MRHPHEVIKQRRRQIILHSCLYYYFDETIIPDSKFDEWSKELVKLQEENPEYKDEFSRYFDGWGGETGYHLCNNDTLDNFSGVIKRILNLGEIDFKNKGLIIYTTGGDFGRNSAS